MKSLIFIVAICLILNIISCDNEVKNTDIKFIETTRSGCADGNIPVSKIMTETKDTIYYTIEDNDLIINTGFHHTCCVYFDDNVELTGNQIIINLETDSDDPCDCICWYEFHFKFADFERKIYNYELLVDGDKKFEGDFDLR